MHTPLAIYGDTTARFLAAAAVGAVLLTIGLLIHYATLGLARRAPGTVRGAAPIRAEFVRPPGRPIRGTLADVLRELEARGSTAHIHLENSGNPADLYLLFGNLYHAEMHGVRGDDAALGALRWDPQATRMDLTDRAPMPAVESVTMSLDQLVSAAATVAAR